MRAFMDAIGLQQVHYLGESIGGILGGSFAARWPERLKSLTICNSQSPSVQPAPKPCLKSRAMGRKPLLLAGPRAGAAC